MCDRKMVVPLMPMESIKKSYTWKENMEPYLQVLTASKAFIS